MITMTDSISPGSGEVPAVPSPIPDYEKLSTAELCAKLKKPIAPLEILVNIKFIMDHDLLFREDFYAEEYFALFSGGRQINITKPEKTALKQRASGRISGFQDVSSLMVINHISVDSLSLNVDRTYNNGLITEGYIRWFCLKRDPDLMYENVEMVVGAPNKISNVPPYAILKDDRPTHRYGHKVGEYLNKFGEILRSIYLTFHSDGTLSMGNFKSQRTHAIIDNGS